MAVTINLLLSSLLAGIMIGIGNYAYIAANGTVLGAIAFGLIFVIIIIKNYPLYTTRIGFLAKIEEIPYFLIIFVGNLIGIFIIASFFRLGTTIDITKFVNAKLALNYNQILCKSILCGIILYSGVTCSAVQDNPLYFIIAAFVLIVMKTEHCMNDAFYFMASPNYALEALKFFGISLLGNTIGSILVRYSETIILKLSAEIAETETEEESEEKENEN